jgi:hypothetical protein
MGPYAGADFHLTLCPLHSQLHHITMGNPMPESTLTLCLSRLYSPGRVLGFGPCLHLLFHRPCTPSPPPFTICTKRNSICKLRRYHDEVSLNEVSLNLQFYWDHKYLGF